MNPIKRSIHNITVQDSMVFIDEKLYKDKKLTEDRSREILKKHRIKREEETKKKNENRFKVKDHYVCRNCVQQHNHTHYHYKTMYEIDMPCGQKARLCITHGKNFVPNRDNTKIKLPTIWDEEYQIIRKER